MMTTAAERIEIPVENLDLDLLNARHGPLADQVEAMDVLLDIVREHILNLADDIANRGLDPSDLPIVMPVKGKRIHVVLEGNRRLAALRLLENPGLGDGSLRPSEQKRLRKASERFKKAPVRTILCAKFKTREEARPWIRLRHLGEQGGVGRIDWGPEENARFEAAAGNVTRERMTVDALDLVRNSGAMTVEELARVQNITTVQRLLDDPDVREQLGVQKAADGRLSSELPVDEVLKGLIRIFRDAAEGRLSVTRVKLKENRREYLKTFSPKELPSPRAGRGELRPVGDPSPGVASAKPAKAAARRRSIPTTQERKTVAPRTLKLHIASPKANNIFQNELKKLQVESFRYSAAVLLRVFFEISVDHYLEHANKMKKDEIQRTKLADKAGKVLQHLASLGEISSKDSRVLEGAYRRDTGTLHAFVHSETITPDPDEIKRIWDHMETLFLKLWK